VTRLGEFSPIERFVSFKHFLENYIRSTYFGATFFNGKSYVLISTKKVWATFWAIFFTNSSCHRGNLASHILQQFESVASTMK
jgi:hypothetical protein